jgi:hypothetical protein
MKAMRSLSSRRPTIRSITRSNRSSPISKAGIIFYSNLTFRAAASIIIRSNLSKVYSRQVRAKLSRFA